MYYIMYYKVVVVHYTRRYVQKYCKLLLCSTTTLCKQYRTIVYFIIISILNIININVCVFFLIFFHCIFLYFFFVLLLLYLGLATAKLSDIRLRWRPNDNSRCNCTAAATHTIARRTSETANSLQQARETTTLAAAQIQLKTNILLGRRRRGYGATILNYDGRRRQRRPSIV